MRTGEVAVGHDRKVVKRPGSSVLIGRAPEVGVLLDAVGDPGVSAVLVAGEAGIGKSRLVAEFTARLGARPLVLTGRCPEFGSAGVPFAPFLAVMRALLRELGVDGLAALLPPRPALANWLPRLALRTGGTGAFDRVRLFGEILTVLEHLAAIRPAVLVLEDLHWADDATRDLLTFLVANLSGEDGVLVGTYRAEAAGPFRGLVGEMRRNPGVRVVELATLTRHEVGRQLAALLEREPEPSLITTVFERSGGNPLFVEALGADPDRMPVGISDLLLGFLSGVSEDARTVLRTAAVIGSPIRHELLIVATELPAVQLNPAIRQTVDRQLLLTTETGYEFRHALIRRAIYEDLLPAERTQIHARLADCLAADESATGRTELARHAAAAGDTEQALTAYWAAARAVTAPPERLHLLEQVRDLWDAVPGAEALVGITKTRLLEDILEDAIASGATGQGLAAVDAALELAARNPTAAPDPLHLAALHRRRAGLLGYDGRDPGPDLLRALELSAESPAGLERAETLSLSAATRVFGGNATGAAEHAAAALEIAERLGAHALIARNHAYLGLASADRIDTALRHFAAAYIAAEAGEKVESAANEPNVVVRGSAPGDPGVVLEIATWEAAVLQVHGRYDAAIETVHRGLRAARDSFRTSPILLVRWTQCLTASGRWDEARDAVDPAEFDRLPPLTRAALLLCYAEIDLARGSFDSARAQSVMVGHLLGDGAWAAAYRLRHIALECRLALECAEPDRAGRILNGDTFLGPVTLSAHPHEAWPVLVLAGRLREPPETLSAAARTLPVSSAVDAAHRAMFEAYSAGTTEHWAAAVHAWRELAQPYEESVSLLAAAEAAVAQGDRDAATRAVRGAVELAGGLGAQPLLDAAERLSRRARLAVDAAVPDATARPSGGFGLTARELEVLRLVARGMSNRAVAGELFISANTAGVHVSRILGKLGVGTRTEAAAFAYANGLLDD